MSVVHYLETTAHKVSEGEYDALMLWKELKQIESVIKEIKADLIDDVTEQWELHGESEVKLHGATFTKSVGGRYDYSHIQEWKQKKAELKDIETSAQEAYKQQQKGVNMVDEEGVVAEAAAYKPNKESISVKL